MVDHPNQIRCADITYIPKRRDFLYPMAMMDRATWKVLVWQVEALQEPPARFGRPEIFNTDQGSRLISAGFIDVLRGTHVRIAMDGRGRWVDSVLSSGCGAA